MVSDGGWRAHRRAPLCTCSTESKALILEIQESQLIALGNCVKMKERAGGDLL